MSEEPVNLLFQRRGMAPQHISEQPSGTLAQEDDHLAFPLSSSFMQLMPLIAQLVLAVVQDRGGSQGRREQLQHWSAALQHTGERSEQREEQRETSE